MDINTNNKLRSLKLRVEKLEELVATLSEEVIALREAVARNSLATLPLTNIGGQGPYVGQDTPHQEASVVAFGYPYGDEVKEGILSPAEIEAADRHHDFSGDSVCVGHGAWAPSCVDCGVNAMTAQANNVWCGDAPEDFEHKDGE